MTDMIATLPLRHRLNLIWVLMWQNFMPRNQRENAKLAWIVIEPIGYITVTVGIFTIVGRSPPYGPSLALWFATGVVPVTFFTQGVQFVAGAVWGLSAPNRLAPIGLFHESIARMLFKFIVTVVYFFIIILMVSAFDGRPVVIYHFEYILLSLSIVSFLMFGWGLCIGFFTIYMSFISKFYNIASRAAVFISGIFFVPSFLPPTLRDWVAWNPLLHAIELMRLAFYPDYPSIVYSGTFLAAVTASVTVLGVSLVWRRRSQLLG